MDNNAQNEMHWNNPKHWGEGLCGMYFCKEDTRLWVPKKIRSLGWTINLGHPKGGVVMVLLMVTPALLMAAGIVASVFLSRCG